MRAKSVNALWLLCVFAANGAAADKFVADTKETFVHKAEGGMFAKKEYPINSSGPSALRAKLKFVSVDKDRTWMPTVGFIVINGDTRVVFHIVLRDTGTRERLLGEIRRGNGPNLTHQQEYQFVARVGTPVEVFMKWTPSGTVTATWTAKETPEQQTLELGLPPQALRIIVSGAKVEYSSLEIGRMRGE